MNLRLTITKDRRNLLWGHLVLMNDLLIENGHTVDEIKNKLQAAIQKYYELELDACHFQVETGQWRKARKMVARLKGKKRAARIEIHFNSDFFT